MRRVLLLLMILCAGCVNRVPQPKATVATPVTVGWALDLDKSADALTPPDALTAALAATLNDRNLQPHDVGALSGPKLTPKRLEQLRLQDPNGWVLLVEARVSFFSQLEGRFRWTVSVKLTASSKPGEVIEDSFSVPAVLQFEHQREPQALASVAHDIASRAGTLLDQLLLAGPMPAASKPTGLVYFVMVDRFANGDSSNDAAIDLADPAAFHGGDLQGVIDRLDWLEALGVRTVWLSPVFAMRPDKYGPYGAFHGYWTWDLTKVDPRFGDQQLLARLSDALHARGMRLVMDLVLNHVGPDAPLVKQRPGWFHGKGGITDWDDAEQLVNNDVHGLPDFATEKEEVYQYLLQASLGWVRTVRPDGFRLDAVKHLPVSFWKRFNADVRAAAGPDFELLGEMLDGDPKVVADVQRQGGFTTMFDFPLHFAIIDVFCKGQSAARLAAVLTSDRLYPSPGTLTTLADNHDLPRLMSQCGNDAAKASAALAFLLATRGAPSIIWGTEVGSLGETDPLNRASMTFSESPLKAEIAKWAALRRVHPSLNAGATRIVEASKDVFAALRVVDGDATLFVFNRSDAVWQAPALPGEWALPLAAPARSVKLFVGKSAALEALASADVTFVARGVAKEDDVRVVGSGPELGAWKPESGLKLLGSSGRARLPQGGVFEFKLAVKSGTGPWRWQAGDNQILQVGVGPQQVELQWREG